VKINPIHPWHAEEVEISHMYGITHAEVGIEGCF
jgi:hypothetical protein